MKIRLKVDPNLTKEQLLEKLPTMAKAIAEAILEKGVSLRPAIEGTHKSHPVRAIAAAEDEVYDQGSDALAGIYSWLLRKLNVEVKKGGDLSEDDFRHEMLEKFGIKLGSTVDHKQAQDIAEVLSMFPSDAMDGRVDSISVNASFGASKRAYPNHGRYYEEAKRIVLNPHIFGEETDYTTDSGEKIEKLMHTLVHEIGHSIDDKHGLSKKKEWRGISGWRYIGDREPNDGEERMLLKDGDTVTLKGRWAYRSGTNFPRWYGARNPKEDFCEAFAFAFLGATHYFKGQTGEAKLAFVRKVISDLVKSQAPGLRLEDVGVSDLEKSQEFWAYTSARAASLVDDQDLSQETALQKAASEFTFEPCDDLLLEKADAPSKPVAAAPAAQPAAQAAGAPATGPNPLKGQQKPGHKYLKRETLPNGKYRYWYQMPTGEVYFSDDKALHDEAKHKEQFPATQQFENFKAGIHPSKIIGQAPEGVESHHFNEAEAPKLVKDIQPHDKQFDPNASPEEKQKAAEEAKVEPAKKEKRQHEELLLRESDADRILQAQGAWEIESVDYEFGKAGVQLSMRVKIKNDGHAMLKPEAGAEKFGEHGGYRADIKEWSTVFREALAYNIDRALGWGLVPPTSIRRLKGDSMKRIMDFVEKREGKDSEVYRALKNKTHINASMQFFADGAERYGDRKGGEMAFKVKDEEVVRGVLFDMIVNHQDRHSQNLLIGPDVDSSNRYGGTHRMVFIDNGYAFGNGEKGISDVADMGFRNVNGKLIDQKTLRDLRKLRDDLHSKVRRRKIVPEEIRAKVPWDQIIRVAHRIDYILSDKNRDAKGRVRIPDWYKMRKWEQEAYPPKFSRRDDPALHMSKAFDISGKTSDLNFHAERKLDNPKAKVPQFKSGSQVQDFLHPLLEHLNPRGKERVKAIFDAYESNHHGNLYSALENFIRKSPKKLVNQLVNNQMFLERIGIAEQSVKDLKRAAKDIINRDLVGEFEGYLRQAGGVDAVQKHARGEMSEADVIKLVGEERFRRFQDRWAVHPKLRGLGKDKLSAIFDDPAAFGWDKKAKKEKPKKEFWHQEQEQKNPNWREGKGKHLPPGEGPLKKSDEPALIVSLEN